MCDKARHWKPGVGIMPTLSSLVTLEVDVMTASSDSCHITMTSQWASCVPNHQQFDSLFNYLLQLTSERTLKSALLALLWGESTGDRRIPLTKGQVTRKAFPLRDVISFQWMDSKHRWSVIMNRLPRDLINFLLIDLNTEEKSSSRHGSLPPDQYPYSYFLCDNTSYAIIMIGYP